MKLGRGLKPFLLKHVRLLKFVDLGQVRIGKDLRKNAPLCALPWNDLAVLASDPTALPAVLVLPVFGLTSAGLGLDVVEPDIFHDLTSTRLPSSHSCASRMPSSA